ncbi:hypothetical protein JKP88DRAFT_247024 [Tribonema minus]|uniref:Uncharacterized protein n=1 Tax=Tribonema minus TaxID=303371 RepID=A0A835YZN9_9STRA|nr:hypothetical protein JKP88DRAFT_247024 [Tribonema minus]
MLFGRHSAISLTSCRSWHVRTRLDFTSKHANATLLRLLFTKHALRLFPYGPSSSGSERSAKTDVAAIAAQALVCGTRTGLRQAAAAGAAEQAAVASHNVEVWHSPQYETLLRKRGETPVDEEASTELFLSRMVAQRNARLFSGTLDGREQQLDSAVIAALDGMTDQEYKRLLQRRGYNIHGHRRIFEERVGKLVPRVTLGDAIEARREGLSCARQFTESLDGREAELQAHLEEGLRDVWRMDVVRPRNVGGYGIDGKIILPEGEERDKRLHLDDKALARATPYVYKATQRFKAAHEDIANAISAKSLEVSKLLRKTNWKLLQSIAEQAVSSSLAQHRQKRLTGTDHSGWVSSRVGIANDNLSIATTRCSSAPRLGQLTYSAERRHHKYVEHQRNVLLHAHRSAQVGRLTHLKGGMKSGSRNMMSTAIRNVLSITCSTRIAPHRWVDSRIFKGGMKTSPDGLREAFEAALRATVAAHDGALQARIKQQFPTASQADTFMVEVRLHLPLVACHMMQDLVEVDSRVEGVFAQAAIFSRDAGGHDHMVQVRLRFAADLNHIADGCAHCVQVQPASAAVLTLQADTIMAQANRDVDHLPGGWREDRQNLKAMKARQKELRRDKEDVAEKIVCPWRPGGQHIAKGPWEPFYPKRRRPPPNRSHSQPDASAMASATEVMVMLKLCLTTVTCLITVNASRRHLTAPPEALHGACGRRAALTARRHLCHRCQWTGRNGCTSVEVVNFRNWVFMNIYASPPQTVAQQVCNGHERARLQRLSAIVHTDIRCLAASGEKRSRRAGTCATVAAAGIHAKDAHEDFLARLNAPAWHVIRRHPRMQLTYAAYSSEPFPCEAPQRSRACSAEEEQRKRLYSRASSNRSGGGGGGRAAAAADGGLHAASGGGGGGNRSPRSPSRPSYEAPERSGGNDAARTRPRSAFCGAAPSWAQPPSLDAGRDAARAAAPARPCTAAAARTQRRPLPARPATAAAGGSMSSGGSGGGGTGGGGGADDLEAMTLALEQRRQQRMAARHAVVQGYRDRHREEAAAAAAVAAAPRSPKRGRPQLASPPGRAPHPADAAASLEAAAREAAAEAAALSEVGASDWALVDLSEAADANETLRQELGVLYEGVTAVALEDSLRTTFEHALELLADVASRLGWPTSGQALWFRKSLGYARGGARPSLVSYARLVGRLSLLWTAACGVTLPVRHGVPRVAKPLRIKSMKLWRAIQWFSEAVTGHCTGSAYKRVAALAVRSSCCPPLRGSCAAQLRRLPQCSAQHRHRFMMMLRAWWLAPPTRAAALSQLHACQLAAPVRDAAALNSQAARCLRTAHTPSCSGCGACTRGRWRRLLTPALEMQQPVTVALANAVSGGSCVSPHCSWWHLRALPPRLGGACAPVSVSGVFMSDSVAALFHLHVARLPSAQCCVAYGGHRFMYLSHVKTQNGPGSVQNNFWKMRVTPGTDNLTLRDLIAAASGKASVRPGDGTAADGTLCGEWMMYRAGPLRCVTLVALFLGRCWAGTSELSRYPGVDTGKATQALLCQDAITTGQAVGMCAMAGDKLYLKSAADLLAAVRFVESAPPQIGDTATSTEPHMRGFLADYTLSQEQDTKRFNSSKRLKGSAQLDLFLCSDPSCDVVADLVHIDTPDQDSSYTLAFGYTRIPGTLMGLPGKHIKATDALTSRSIADSGKIAGLADGATVIWTMDDPQWVDATPVMLSYGAAVRFIGMADAKNWNFERLRIGNYETRAGECVTIITFVHPWMDEQGWRRASACVGAARTYVFDSYFPQANLLWPPAQLANAAVSDSYANFEVANFNIAARAAALGQAPPGANTSNETDNVYMYGRTLQCDWTMYTNGQATPADTNNCYAAGHNWGVQIEAEGIVTPLVIGNASILAWDISEAWLSQNATTGHWTMGERGDWWNGGDHSNVPPEYKTKQPTFAATDPNKNPLLKLGAYAQWTDATSAAAAPLPWCSTAPEKFANAVHYANVHVPSLGGYVDWRRCNDAWGALGWGPIDFDPVTSVPARPLAEVLQPSWANVNYNHPRTQIKNFAAWDTATPGIGFAGYEYPIPGALTAGVETVKVSAAALLDQATQAELATSDFTSTTWGAVLGLALTTVALIASYAGRDDIVSLFARFMPFCAAKAVSALVFAFGIVAPSAMAAYEENAVRGENARGDVTSVRWVEGAAMGYGQYKARWYRYYFELYVLLSIRTIICAVRDNSARGSSQYSNYHFCRTRQQRARGRDQCALRRGRHNGLSPPVRQYKVVAAVSYRFVSVYDPAAYVLIWANVALSAASAALICVSVMRLRQRNARGGVKEGWESSRRWRSTAQRRRSSSTAALVQLADSASAPSA